MVKVSVVVPVYNPGRNFRRCLDSLIGQSLPPQEYELIFVDDGSTDETPATLDRAAARFPGLRVLHQTNSGWPGQPRNRGLDAASGEYVFFCDDDDWLATDALEVLCRFAVENASDMVLAKMGGLGRPVPRALFTRTRPLATLADAPLMDSLTVHKLFRRAFLVDHHIRFPEGRRRLEDHLFMARAYLAAERIGIYADHTCYFHARWDSNASAESPHWPAHFGNLEEAIEVVEQHTEPGPFRDRLLSRWLRVEMVNRLSGQALLKRSPDDVGVLFDAAHVVARAHFGDGVVARLNPADRPVGRAIVAGTLPVVRERAAAVAGWRVEPRILQIGWADTTLQLCGTVDLVEHDTIRDGRAEARFIGLFADVDVDDVERAWTGGTVTVDLDNPATGERIVLQTTTHGTGLTRSFTTDIDIGELPLDETVSSTWSFQAQFRILGIGGRARLVVVDERSLLFPLAASISTIRPVAVTSSDGRRAELVVGAAARRRGPRSPAATARHGVARVVRTIRRRLGQPGSRST